MPSFTRDARQQKETTKLIQLDYDYYWKWANQYRLRRV